MPVNDMEYIYHNCLPKSYSWSPVNCRFFLLPPSVGRKNLISGRFKMLLRWSYTWQRIKLQKASPSVLKERKDLWQLQKLFKVLWCCESYPWSVRILRECALSDCLGTAAGLSYTQCCVSRQWASGGTFPFGIQRSGFKFRRSHCSCTPYVPYITVMKTLLWDLTPDDVLGFTCAEILVTFTSWYNYLISLWFLRLCSCTYVKSLQWILEISFPRIFWEC